MAEDVHFQTMQTNRVRSYHTRQSLDASRAPLNGPAPATLMDKFALLPILACVFALIVSPLLLFLTDLKTLESQTLASDARPENRIFWPALAAISLVLVVRNRSRLTLPSNIICLLAYLAFAGASVLWAFSPESSFVRFIQEVMIVSSIALPAMLASRTADMMRGLFLCFALALMLNVFFVLAGNSTIVSYGSKLVDIGYEGYFEGKNYLGECAAIALLLSLYELHQRGWRRVFAAVLVLTAISLIWLSDSKTAFGLALVCPLLAALTLMVRKVTRLSPAIILLSIPLCYALTSSLSKTDIVGRISYILYHDSTLTGRTIIWDFAQTEIERSPLIGWGYRSFWLVPNSPAFDAPGWVKMMPNGHNGYVDTKLELGYIGLAFLIVFIISTLHAVGKVANRDPRRAQLVLSLALFIILYNFFESLWMRGFEFMWVVFIIVAAEIGRYSLPFPTRRAAYRSRSRTAGHPGPSPGGRGPQRYVGLSS